MAIETINLGTYANDGQGDDLRSAFLKVNSNFTQLDNIVAVDGINLGNGEPIFASKVTDPGIGDKLTFRSIKAGNNINISSDSTTITIEGLDSIHNIVEDASPQLGGSLDLNGNDVTGTGNINIAGNIVITGTTTAGNFIGNLSGNAGSVTNGVYTVGDQTVDGIKTFIHEIQANISGNAGTVTNGVYTTSSINSLSDVDTQSQQPVPGQALVWSGTNWVPGNVSSGGGGQGDTLDFGSFTTPLGTDLDMGSFV